MQGMGGSKGIMLSDTKFLMENKEPNSHDLRILMEICTGIKVSVAIYCL